MAIAESFKAFFTATISAIINFISQIRPIPEPEVAVVPSAAEQNRQQLMLEWQKAVMAFCFTSALEIAVLFAQIESQLPFSFHLLSFTILLIFLSLFVANFIGRNFTATIQVLEIAAVMLVSTAVVFTITIPFPLPLKCVIWALYAVSLTIVGICRYRS